MLPRYAPTLSSVSVGYPTTITESAVWKMRADLPMDVSQLDIRLNLWVMCPDGCYGTLEGVQGVFASSASDTTGWFIGDVDIEFFNLGEDQYKLLTLTGTAFPNQRMGSTRDTDEAAWLNVLSTTWTAGGTSTGNVKLVSAALYVKPHLSLEPDLDAGEEVCLPWAKPGTVQQSSGFWRDWVTALELLYELLPHYPVTHQDCGENVSATYKAGYPVTMTGGWDNLLSNNGEFYCLAKGRCYEGTNISIVCQFYTSVAAIAKLMWYDFSAGTWYDAGSTFTTAAGGWNEIERQIDIGIEDDFLLKVLATGSGNITTAGFGFRFYHENVIDELQ
jgi:hypothetical protein